MAGSSPSTCLQLSCNQEGKVKFWLLFMVLPTFFTFFFQAQIKLSLMSLLGSDNSFFLSPIPMLFELSNKLRSPSTGADGSSTETLALGLKESHCICFNPSNYWTRAYSEWTITSWSVCSCRSRVGSLSLGKFGTKSLWVIINKP